MFKNIIKSIDWEYNNFVMGRDQEVTDFMYDNGLKSSVSGDIIVSPDKVIERYEREKKINKILKENKRIKNKPYDDYYVRKRFNEYHEKRMKNKREDL